MSDRLAVLIVEDDPFTRSTLATTLDSLGFDVVAAEALAARGLAVAKTASPDVAVLDLDLGEGPTGIDLAHRLRELLPSIGIVVLSTYAEPRLMGQNQAPLPVDAIYVVKRTVTDPQVLARAVRMSVDPDSRPISTTASAAEGTDVVDRLTDQQIDLMRLVAAGYSNAEIARRRSVEVPSVEKAMARLIRQLNLKGHADINQRVLIAQKYYELTGAVSARRD